MNFQHEEIRVKSQVAKLLPVYPPLGHSRVKWNARASQDLQEIVQSLGKILTGLYNFTHSHFRDLFIIKVCELIIKPEPILCILDNGKFMNLLRQPQHTRMTNHNLVYLYWEWTHNLLGKGFSNKAQQLHNQTYY